VFEVKSVLFLVLAIGCTLTTGARAQGSLDACLAAHESGQSEQQKNELLAAREHFRICSSAPCPSVVQKDCISRLAETESRIPTLEIRVTGGKSVQLSIDDGAPERISDKPIPLDPGRHRVRAWDADGTELKRSVDLQPGERDTLELEFDTKDQKPEPNPNSVRSGPSPFGYVLGGVAVVGVLGFTGFGLAGRSKQSKLNACKPQCDDPGLYDDMQRNYLIADISLGVAVAAGVGAYLVLSAKPSETGVTSVRVKPSKRGGSLFLGARF
jgi:hypothetical protein